MLKKLPLIVGIALIGSSVLMAAPAGAGGMRSTIGAGYLQNPSVGVSVGETEVRVPKITCAHKNDTEELWLGVEAYTGAWGTGSDDLYAQVVAECVSGAITYTAYAKAPGGDLSSGTVQPGDVIDTYIRSSTASPGSVATINGISGHDLGQIANSVGNLETEASILVGQQDVTHSAIPKFLDQKTSTNTIYFLNSYVNGYLMPYDTYPTEQLNQADNHVEIFTSPLNAPQNRFHLMFHFHF